MPDIIEYFIREWKCLKRWHKYQMILRRLDEGEYSYFYFVQI